MLDYEHIFLTSLIIFTHNASSGFMVNFLFQNALIRTSVTISSISIYSLKLLTKKI